MRCPLRVFALSAAVIGLAGCGLKGPLRLPPAHAHGPAAASSDPAPASNAPELPADADDGGGTR